MSLLLTSTILFLSALLGGLAVVLFKLKFSKNIKLLISFSGAFLLAICVLHLIPEIFDNYNKKIGLFILLGFIIQLLLEFFSEGIEHGHFHSHKKGLAIFPYAIFISLCLHSFIEGMALLNIGNDAHNSNALLIGIVIHKIPIAIVLGTLLLAKNSSKISLIIALLLFSISAPLGLYLAENQLISIVEHKPIILALALGIFLHISTTILFESTDSHKFDLKKFVIILLGFALAIFTL